MKKTFVIFVACGLASMGANASRNSDFKSEIRNGLPRIETYHDEFSEPMIYQETTNIVTGVIDMPEYDQGCADARVIYGPEPVSEIKETEGPAVKMFVPTPMYVRIGGGLNLSMATKKASVGEDKFKTEKSWNATIGLGWNILSFLRTEIAFQESRFQFRGVPDFHANYHTLNSMVYFDLPPRYEYRGDAVYRRSFVPFIGIGAGVGEYEFIGPHGADGFVVAAPRAELGMNFMLTDLIGVDIAYQYQMFLGHGFGWSTKRNGLDGISNVMATIRANF